MQHLEVNSSRHFPNLSHWTTTLAATLRHLTVQTNNGLCIILFLRIRFNHLCLMTLPLPENYDDPNLCKI
jgi:hypothetical protein